MQSSFGLLATLTTVGLWTTLTACASLGPAAEGAVSANLEIEEMQNKIVLLNIARTSLRRPPTYTTLSSVAGKVRPTGGISLAIPFGPNLSAGGTGTATLSAQANDAPTVTLSPLETQEFYNGIMSPIKKETIDFYVQQGFSRALLFNLFFSRIEVDDGSKIKVYRNYPGNDDDIIGFQRLVNQLINDGLTTETVSSKSTPYGPLRTADEVKELDAVANAAKAELVITEVAPCALEAADWIALIQRRKVAGPENPKRAAEAHEKLKKACKENTAPHHVVLLHFPGAPTSFYRVEKPGGKASARFCFAEKPRDDALRCKEKPKSPASAASDDGGRFTVEQEQDAANEKRKPTYAFVLRSTDAVLYYLGEVARRQLYPDPVGGKIQDKRAVAFHYKRGFGLPSSSCWEAAQDGDPPCYPIVTVRDNDVHDAFVSVGYDGRTYTVPARREETIDRSSQVFSIVVQLLALHKSAKDIPQTSILQVVNP